MEEAASSSSSSAATAASSSSSAEAAGTARELLREWRDAIPLVFNRHHPTQHRGLRDPRRAGIQQWDMFEQQLDAQLIDNAVVNGMAMQLELDRGGGFVEQPFDMPSSSQSAEHNTIQDFQSSEMPSWFESSVEDLFRSIQPPLLADGGRASLDETAEGHLSSGQGSKTPSNYKRPKVLGFSTPGLKACSRGSQNSCGGASHAASSLGCFYTRGQQRESLPSILPTEQDNGDEEQGNSSNGSGGKDINPESEMEGDAPSMYLTDDLLHTVFSFLDQRNLCEAGLVCRQWRTASEHEDFWKSLHFGSKITQDQVASLCRRFPRAVDLSFMQVNLVDEVAREAMHSLRYLEKLSIYKGSLSDSFFTSLASDCPVLYHLTVNDSVLGSVGAQEVLIRHRSLCELRVTECRVMRIGIRCPRLEQLYLKQTNMASAILHCPCLLSLDVSSCMKLSDAGVRLAAASCRMLLDLNLSQCSYVSDETLREIGLACSNLQVLDASFCPNISLQGVRMPVLRELMLNSCEGINSSSMAALSQCFRLEALSLEACALLTAVTLNLPRLHKISLGHCNKLVELTLKCPALVQIDVTDCCVLKHLEISSLALKRLSLQKQPILDTLALDCPHLLVMNFVECDSLENSICEVLSDGGGCPSLSSLTLESCERLSELRLCSTTLNTLSLAGCQSLVQVDLACANLQQLLLDGCQQLSSVILAPVGLQLLNLGICPYVKNLKIESSSMVSVDLKGCGLLNTADINCPQLLSLDASYCSSLDDKCLEAATMACPLIQSLILACCPSIGPPGLLTLKKLGNLTTLDLSYTFLTDLSPIFESCKRLKVLRLLACKYLGDSALDALHCKETLPELRELDLSYGGLGHDALKGVLTKCTYLTHVNFNGCAKLSDLVWEVSESALSSQNSKDWQHESQAYDKLSTIPKAAGDEGSFSVNATENLVLQEQRMAFPHALQQLNCVGCPNMKRVEILDAAGFHDLSSSNFSLSSNLKEAWFECPFLTTLNLSHCTTLESLQVNCPRLVSLSLQASSIRASDLEAVLQGCTALETLDIRNSAKISAEDLIDVRAACPRLKRLLSSAS